MSPAGSTDNYKLVHQGDFVISLRSFQGGIEYSRYKGLVSPAYTVLRAKKEIVSNFYLYFFKTYIFVEKYLSIAVIGIRDGKQVNVNHFSSVKIPYPPIQVQEKISIILSESTNEIGRIKILLRYLKQQKKGLMQKLLTGEVRVKI